MLNKGNFFNEFGIFSGQAFVFAEYCIERSIEAMSVLNQSGEEQVECPLCMEPLEVDDLNFYPCTCGYQVSCNNVLLCDNPIQERVFTYLYKNVHLVQSIIICWFKIGIRKLSFNKFKKVFHFWTGLKLCQQ